MLREHCDAEGRDYDEIEKTCYFLFDVGEKGEKAGRGRRPARRARRDGLPGRDRRGGHVWDVTPLEIIGSEVIPAVASL